MTTAVLDDSTAHQARARMALSAALEAGPSHAYLFRGPRGAGKRAAARAFAAEILAGGAEDPDDVRRRALLDPSPHPDLVWLTPSGAQHLVEDVRARVIRAAAYRPYEGGKRVFVVEAAEAMRDESQNALLKTLEEPPEFVHLILLTSEPAGLLETIASRCQPVDFAPLPVEAVEAELAGDAGGGSGTSAGADEIAAAARLAAGDVELARLLLSERGREVRAQAERLAAAALDSDAEQGEGGSPWQSSAQRRGASRRGRRIGGPRGARSRKGGRRQALCSRPRRRGETGRPPPPHRAARPRPGSHRRSGSATSPRSPPALPTSPTTATASTCSSRRPPASTPTAPAAPPSWSRTPAAASTSMSPRSWP